MFFLTFSSCWQMCVVVKTSCSYIFTNNSQSKQYFAHHFYDIYKKNLIRNSVKFHCAFIELEILEAFKKQLFLF